MAKYMYQATYTVEGVRGLLKETASGRRKAVESAIAALGGKVEAFYYCFGENDVVLIMDLPDNVAAAGVGLTVAACRIVRRWSTAFLPGAEAGTILAAVIGC